MTKRILHEDLSEREKAALETLFSNARKADDFRQKLADQNIPVEEMVKRRRSETAQQRDLRVRASIDTFNIGNQAGIVHEPELFLLRVARVEQVCDDRICEGLYDVEFAEVDHRAAELKREHGLSEDEFWMLGEGPPEWEALDQEHSAITSRLLVTALREFGLLEEAALLESKPAEFYLRRELARRALYEGLPDEERLRMVQAQFDKEASASAEVGAFHAAATMVGAAIEAALLVRCVRSSDAAIRAVSRLPQQQRPRRREPRDWSFAELTRVASAAGWLPEFDVPAGIILSDKLIDMVRDLRNMVHPAVHLRNGITTRIVRAKYEDARAVYDLLARHLKV